MVKVDEMGLGEAADVAAVARGDAGEAVPEVSSLIVGYYLIPSWQ